MKITGARVAFGASQSHHADFAIRNGRILFSGAHRANEPVLDLSGFLLLPGLVNAHDHLEFNLFPRLGNGPYRNAREWASDIHRPWCSPVKEHLAVPKPVRILWGGLKNLLSGATTVAHHNPCDDPCFDANFPVKVVRQSGFAHSLDFSPDLVGRYHATPLDWPFIFHAAEGIDEQACSEVSRLDALGILTDRAVLVHAIGVNQSGLNLLKARGSSVVWCPTSNLSTYGTTLRSAVFHSTSNVALGTDSALTAQTDLIDEIKTARNASGLSLDDLYEMVTVRSARLLRLHDGQGCLRHAGVADLLAVADYGQSPASALEGMVPEMVMVGGRIRLISRRLLHRATALDPGALQPIHQEGRGTWLTDVDVSSLHRETVRNLGPEYRLAGKEVRPC
jgi:cytosine/adenosine deaminase-related metal-dependent hydrolase